jgi:hypothetical protein
MTTLIWVVECDSCGGIIDATEEPFFENDGEQFCQECNER